jgi:HEAT repeat protein
VLVNPSIRDVYDVPVYARQRTSSEAFKKFLYYWFADTRQLTRDGVEVSFLDDLTLEERELAKDLLRRNLKLRQTHIIEGTALLGDLEAVPLLRDLLAQQSSLSWQLTISGVLWKLVGDPAFPEFLHRMVSSDDTVLKRAHIHQVLWLRDERVIDLLIGLLDHKDESVRRDAFCELNCLDNTWRDAAEYRRRRNDPALRSRLMSGLQK